MSSASSAQAEQRFGRASVSSTIDPILVFVGTFTQETSRHFAGAHGGGIVSLELNPSSGHLTQRHVFRELFSPSFLACSPKQRHLLAVECTLERPGRVASLTFDPAGQLGITTTRATHGRSGCHICTLPNENICVACYVDACIDAYSTRDGDIADCICTLSYHGTGPNKSRQEAAHAHQVAVDPSGRFLYVCDLGADCIWIHELHGGVPAPSSRAAKSPAGYGPRHLVFHPTCPMAYVICELSANVLTYSVENATGNLRLVNDTPALPLSWNGVPAGSAIRVHPSGKALYVSQRNHHSLTVFRVADGGALSFIQHLPCGGMEPRDFDFDPSGRWLIVTNQNSDNLATFEVDPTDGQPLGGARYSTPIATPACVVFAQLASASRPSRV
jgi:6-phosphogluconolactonase